MTYTATPNEDGVYELTYTGNSVAMGVKSIVSQDTSEAYTPGRDVDGAGEVDYVVRYFKDVNNNGVFDGLDTNLADGGYDAPSEVGNYFIVAIDEKAHEVWRAAGWDLSAVVADNTGKLTANAQGVIAQYFKVVPQSLEGAQVVNAAGTSEFTYNGSAQDIYLSLDGKDLVPGKDFSLQILNANGDAVTVTDNGDYYTTAKLNAGEYTAVVTGMGGYQSTTTSNESIEIKFTVDKLDLSSASVFSEDLDVDEINASSDFSKTVSVDGVSLSELLSDVEREQISYTDKDGKVYGASDESGNYKDLVESKTKGAVEGGYTFRLTMKAGNTNVTGSVDFTQNVCTEIVGESAFKYDGVQLFDSTSTVTPVFDGTVFDLSEGEAYDASKITVDGHKASEYTVSLATADAAKAGEYTVSVKMNVPSDFSIGGGSMANFTVLNGIIDSASVEAVLLIDGVNYGFIGDDGYKAYTAPYVPEGVEPNVTIKAGKTVLTEGEDYDVVYTDSTGAEVEAMVDADTYTVTVKLKNGYAFDGNGTVSKSLNVQILQRELDSVELVEDFVLSGKTTKALLYTGSEIAPQFVGTYTAGGKEFKVVLDSSWYDVTGVMFMAPTAEKFIPAESILEAGEYKVNLTPAAACKNYTWDAQIPVDAFQVVKAAKFADVASDAWYAGSVLSASANGYMNGFAGTNLFGPLAEISRAEVAQVFYNMAGATSGNWATNDFSDVEQKDWFAASVAWASAYGIVTGYEGTDLFGPSDDATREQVATMIYRYAKAQGMDVTVEDEAAALAKYKDGASVSDFAKTAMAYCVEQGVFGVDVDTLRPQDNLSRAEMAATSVRVQPEGKHDTL